MIYAEIEGGVVKGLLNTPTPIIADHMIDVTASPVAIGQTYSNGVFGPVQPVLRNQLSKREFRNKFTHAEKQAIYNAKVVNVDVAIFLDDLANVDYVDVTDAQTITSVTALETAGLLEAGRAAEILTGV
jgi:hypothetical protein